MSTITQTIIDGIASITGLDSILDSNGNARFVSTLGTEIATTSGTSIDIENIPDGVKEIIIMFESVSVSGTSNIIVQVGDAGGIEDTGYDSGAVQHKTTSTYVNATDGFITFVDTAADDAFTGKYILNLKDASNNTWIGNGFVGDDGAATSNTASSYGYKSLSAVLDKIRLTTQGGSDTFDAGSINIQYRF